MITSPRPDIRESLARKKPLLADGAMGTSLMKRGLISGDAPELWNVEEAEKILSVHREFAEAGSDILLTNSFGGNAKRLKLHRLEGRLVELNQAGVNLARKAALETQEKTGREIFVAGSVGPLGELIAPLGEITKDEAVDCFRAQIEALAEAGADVIWIETMSSREEALAALKGAQTVKIPIVTTMSFDTAGKTMMGISPEEAGEFLSQADPLPLAVGANCGLGTTEALIALRDIIPALENGVLSVVKSNCGVPVFKDGAFHHSATPELMGLYAELARDIGADIIGGCCGSDGTHISAMATSLEKSASSSKNKDFSDEAIIALTGPFAAPVDSPIRKEKKPNRRRRANP